MVDEQNDRKRKKTQIKSKIYVLLKNMEKTKQN